MPNNEKIVIKGKTFYDASEHYSKDDVDDKLVDVAFLSTDTPNVYDIHREQPSILTPREYYTKQAADYTFAKSADVGNKDALMPTRNANVVAALNETYEIAISSNNSRYEIVDELPATGQGNLIYLVPVAGQTGKYNQYIWS